MNHSTTDEKFIFIYSERHESYDLFGDLKGKENIDLHIVGSKPVRNPFSKALKKVHLSSIIAKRVKLPMKHIWYTPLDIETDDSVNYQIVVVDIALAGIPTKKLQELFAKKNVNGYLLLVNSIGSDVVQSVKKKIDEIKWDGVYTFDGADAEKYGYENADYCYYSKHDEKILEKYRPQKPSDAYFVGILKAGRNQEVLSLFKKLRENGVQSEFHLMKTGKDRTVNYPYKDEIDYFTPERGWISYDEILGSVLMTNTIIEVVQKVQSGPSLRYYEAICYNRKLLTNNPDIVNFPLYDPRYMRVYRSVEDIDTDWVKEKVPIDYGYSGEFSPLHLLEKISDRK